MALKSTPILALSSLLVVSTALAQPVQQIIPTDQAADGVYRAVELGPHHRSWQRIVEVQDENGFLKPQTNSYVELATGLNTWVPDTQQWAEASDEIEILEAGAIARKSQHHVSFAGNLNDPNGTIDLLTRNGQRLRSRVVGLAYTEADTGRSVFIGEVKDSQGFVLGRNQVLYLDAFDSVKGEVRFTTTRSSFEQDIILREQLPSPVDYGFDPAKTKLEVWTQFFEAPPPVIKQTVLRRRSGVEENDSTLSFGAMQIGPGRAFSLGVPDAAPGLPDGISDSLGVVKEWQVIPSLQAVQYLNIWSCLLTKGLTPWRGLLAESFIRQV